jgi:hypothetical protein
VVRGQIISEEPELSRRPRRRSEHGRTSSAISSLVSLEWWLFSPRSKSQVLFLWSLSYRISVRRTSPWPPGVSGEGRRRWDEKLSLDALLPGLAMTIFLSMNFSATAKGRLDPQSKNKL